MTNKNHPGPFNCYAAALPDEPIFVILGRDPAAPRAMREWSKERDLRGKNKTPDDIERIHSVNAQIQEMIVWRDRNLNPHGYGVPAWHLPRPSDDRADAPPAHAPATLDEHPDDLAHAPEVPPHRFSMFHKGEHYAYARGLEINPTHLPIALDEMLRDGWKLLSIFGATDSKHVGFIFERSKVDDPALS